MARLNVDDHSLSAALDTLDMMRDLPNEMLDPILQAGAAPLLKALQFETSRLGEKHGTGGLRASLKVNRPAGKRGKRHIDITFEGSRANPGGTSRLNSTIAFFNEFGSKRIKARHFVKRAVDTSADEVANAMADAFDHAIF